MSISGRISKSVRRMTESEIETAARNDPDAQPFSDDDIRRMKRTPQVKIIRRALRLTQEEFAQRFAIPLGTLRDWEQGRSEPDQPAKSYLKVIASDPKGVSNMLARSSRPAKLATPS